MSKTFSTTSSNDESTLITQRHSLKSAKSVKSKRKRLAKKHKNLSNRELDLLEILNESPVKKLKL